MAGEQQLWSGQRAHPPLLVVVQVDVVLLQLLLVTVTMVAVKRIGAAPNAVSC